MEEAVVKALLEEALSQAMEKYIEEKLSGRLSGEDAALQQAITDLTENINLMTAAIHTLLGAIIGAVFLFIIISTYNHRRL